MEANLEVGTEARRRARRWLLAVVALVGCSACTGSANPAKAEPVPPKVSEEAGPPVAATRDTAVRHPWPSSPDAETVVDRFPAPRGFTRLAVEAGSFGAWLRTLPLYPAGRGVRLYDGSPKPNQGAQSAVMEIDVGSHDLQQCADAVIRLRAEYLFARGCHEAVAFHYTSGDLARWTDWASGIRPEVDGNRVSWRSSVPADDGYRSFRNYLDSVFLYAGSASLERELDPVADPRGISAGDVFIQGGFPGHAVIVVDVAEDRSGNRRFLLAQSFMPAQDVHVLRNPDSESDPWYEARSSGTLITPEWTFDVGDLRRFPRLSEASTDCGEPDP